MKQVILGYHSRTIFLKLVILGYSPRTWFQKQVILGRLVPVLKMIFHQCIISYTCSQSNSDGSVSNRAIRV